MEFVIEVYKIIDNEAYLEVRLTFCGENLINSLEILESFSCFSFYFRCFSPYFVKIDEINTI